MDRPDRDTLRGELRIGIHSGAQVVFARRFERLRGRQLVSQACCSALSCGYTTEPLAAWEPFVGLVLEAAYEATLRSAALEARGAEGSGRVGLALIGGGVFRHDPRWISDAIVAAFVQTRALGLNVRIAHDGAVHRAVADRIDRQLSAHA